MDYIIHYDIAAVVIAIATMIHFFYKRNVVSIHTKLFAIMVILALLTSVLDVASVYYLNQPDQLSMTGHYLLNVIYLAAFNAIPVIYFFYLLLVAKNQRDFTGFDYGRMICPYVLNLVLIVTTPWTHLIFWFDEAGTYYHGIGFGILLVIAFLYMGMAVVDTLRFRRRFTRAQKVSVLFYTLVCTGVVLV